MSAMRRASRRRRRFPSDAPLCRDGGTENSDGANAALRPWTAAVLVLAGLLRRVARGSGMAPVVPCVLMGALADGRRVRGTGVHELRCRLVQGEPQREESRDQSASVHVHSLKLGFRLRGLQDQTRLARPL